MGLLSQVRAGPRCDLRGHLANSPRKNIENKKGEEKNNAEGGRGRAFISLQRNGNEKDNSVDGRT
jgi:hypothetical protein